MTPATFTPSQIYAHSGCVYIGRVRLDQAQADQLLALWKGEMREAFDADDHATWTTARELHNALWRAMDDIGARRPTCGWAAERCAAQDEAYEAEFGKAVAHV